MKTLGWKENSALEKLEPCLLTYLTVFDPSWSICLISAGSPFLSLALQRQKADARQKQQRFEMLPLGILLNICNKLCVDLGQSRLACTDYLLQLPWSTSSHQILGKAVTGLCRSLLNQEYHLTYIFSLHDIKSANSIHDQTRILLKFLEERKCKEQCKYPAFTSRVFGPLEDLAYFFHIWKLLFLSPDVLLPAFNKTRGDTHSSLL